MPIYLLVAASAWISKAVNIAIRLFTLPFLLNYLGVEKFAVFSIVTSLEGWFLLCDYGIGSSIQNFISEARAKNDNPEKWVQATAQISLIFLIFSLAILLFLSRPLESFIFKGFTRELIQGEKNLILLAGGFYIFSAIGSIGYRALYAFQKGYWIYIFQALSGIFSLLCLIFLRYFYHGDLRLTFAVLIAALGPSLFSGGVFFVLFLKKNLLKSFCLETILQIFKRGAHFWIYSILVALILFLDYFIMARTLTPREITIYHILYRIYFGIFFVYSALILAIWPTCSEMIIHHQWSAIHAMIKRYILLGCGLIFAATCLLLLFSKEVAFLFFKDKSLFFESSTILYFGLYLLIRIICDTYAMLFQSMSQLKVFFLFMPFQALLSIGLQLLLSKKFGTNGILLGLICSFVFTILWGLPLTYARMKKYENRTCS